MMLDDDTPTRAQQQIQDCVTAALQGLDPIDKIRVAGALIETLRDHVLAELAHVRKTSVIEAKAKFTSAEISDRTGLTRATVSRLLYTGRRDD